MLFTYYGNPSKILNILEGSFFRNIYISILESIHEYAISLNIC
ncbi:hypothetical protein BC751_1592 [Cecembia calidifontis]|uniref:Uncharacterized protein n=1 Tax=Cecembia calidifontis TaxID=1187080 RepID=A0A4Q7P901_9BACT|nr:hypothetical protein BC751_1592 [Cecembia calidifontis]